MDIYIDAGLVASVSLDNGGAKQVQVPVWGTSGLSAGSHTIRIVAQTAATAYLDAFRVYP